MAAEQTPDQEAAQSPADPHQAHEQKLAAALRDLVHQIDISDYRDTIGHPMKNNLSFIRAQAIADEFCVTHGDICSALDHHDDDGLDAAVQHLLRRSNEASPEATPPEYRTWTTGP